MMFPVKQPLKAGFPSVTFDYQSKNPQCGTIEGKNDPYPIPLYQLAIVG